MTYTIQKRLRDSGCLDFALVDEAADHIDTLEADNKRLRDELAANDTQIEALHQIDTLEADNKRLRDIVATGKRFVLKALLYGLPIALLLITSAHAGKSDLLTKEQIERTDAKLRKDAFYDLMLKTVRYVACKGLAEYDTKLGEVIDALEYTAAPGVDRAKIIRMIATRAQVISIEKQSKSAGCWDIDEELFGKVML